MASSMTCILLAINRFGELLTIGIISSMFKVLKHSISLVYSIEGLSYMDCSLPIPSFVFSRSLLFSSNALQFNVSSSVVQSNDHGGSIHCDWKWVNQSHANPFQFTNYLNTVLSISMPCISFSIYVVMICSMYIKHGRVRIHLVYLYVTLFSLRKRVIRTHWMRLHYGWANFWIIPKYYQYNLDDSAVRNNNHNSHDDLR